MRRTATLLLLLLGLAIPGPMSAQKFARIVRCAEWVDSTLAARGQRIHTDTAYVFKAATRWTLSARSNISGAKIEVMGISEGERILSQMKADYKTTLSACVNYRGLAVSLALNPAKLMGRYKDYEVGLRSYGNRLGFDFVYQEAQNFKGWYERGNSGRIALPSDILKLRAINANAYYVFNHRHFSYPAALCQSYIQRRSAGSLLAGISFQGQQARSEDETNMQLRVMNFGVGAGYGYNYVPGRNWLLHLSLVPTLIFYSHTSLKVYDQRVPLRYHFPEGIITGRAAVVKQFKRYFAGATGVYYFTNIGNKDRLEIENTKWQCRAIFGIRL